MFEKKKEFSWKVPMLVLLGVIVLSCGIGIGVQVKDTHQTRQVLQSKTESKEVFSLNSDCEIWVQGQITSSGTYESPKMIGTIPKDLLNKSKDEIVSYFKDKYPNKEIASMNQYEIILSNSQAKEPSKANKYAIEEKDGFVHVYKYDKDGAKTDLEKTNISVDSLPKSVQDELSSGILVNSEDEAYTRLENFES
ncbi:MAG: hypothetical protein E6356_07525 [Terrisporobacter othiniensis]|uniref:Bypass of forespore C C-terminal domain-containing protein n=3 Tax=Terrisporobacter TaxID=1505652 RepID=A0AAX2ZD16_9FIRM|nr:MULTISPECIES: hypothetical protein [Terrisporobacter]MBN9648451.1 hypothetical protein [Terrisporobacter glycolicus]MDU4861363.1 hypothetical protein [Terrisporobacter othiniensis]MDU6994688.1 hypothetical protein [Terrisporobacter othiniensis]UEL46215.1 hypothetical protein JW646_11175 [Terrisporobacter hibernicus]UPA30171.1 hypothetical protein L0P85_16585 [Terrisporobacter glycolicus]